jgi:hypothetical protein
VSTFVGELIDQLITIETVIGLPHRNFIRPLYQSARQRWGDPLTALAATRLKAAIAPGDAVLLVTGAGLMPLFPHGETDGPVGLAVLGRVLQQGLGAKPVYVGAPQYLPPIVAAGRAAGHLFVPAEWDAEQGRPHTLSVAVPFPLGAEQADAVAARILAEYRPKAIITSEVLGPASSGVIHSRTGLDITADNPHVGALFAQGRAAGILTICLGDGGNEVGMGALADQVAAIIPYGDACRCGCGSGIGDTTECDLVVVANISDWAAYGIAALIAYELGRFELLPTPAEVEQVLDAAVMAGAVDGATCLPNGNVDGTARETQGAVMQIIRQIVRNHLSQITRPY